MSDKVVMFPSKDPKGLERLTCPACGFHIFTQAYMILHRPGIISRTGLDQQVPIGPAWMCLNSECGKISTPSELVLQNTEEVDAG